MLRHLSLRDVVLIEALDLEFAAGLSVLTGETGAGKSILLDALLLALGARADAGLIRPGAARATVAAEFDLAAAPAARALAESLGLDLDDGRLLLRRVVGADGRSRAFANEAPIAIAGLRALGEALVELEDQDGQLGLLEPSGHRDMLDAFGRHRPLVVANRAAHAAAAAAAAALAAASAGAAERARRLAEVEQALADLDRLAPRPGEAAALLEQRAALAQGAKLAEAVAAAREHLAQAPGGGAEAALAGARRALARLPAEAGAVVAPALAAVDRALSELTEAAAQLEALARDLDPAGGGLERVEDRLHALRAAARRHGCDIDGLLDLRARLAAEQADTEDSPAARARLADAAARTRADFAAAAGRLGAARRAAAAALDQAVAAELAPLKLDKARFATALDPLPEPDWGPEGAERVGFTVATLPGAAPGPLHRIASGGERARLLLALKVSLADVRRVPTLVFDEVDRGVGGATAAAVGARLAALGRSRQVLVVTHSPQVAARADHHYRVEKRERAGVARTGVERLDDSARREEIARMLAGSRVTPAARAAAEALMAGAGR